MKREGGEEVREKGKRCVGVGIYIRAGETIDKHVAYLAENKGVAKGMNEGLKNFKLRPCQLK